MPLELLNRLSDSSPLAPANQSQFNSTIIKKTNTKIIIIMYMIKKNKVSIDPSEIITL